MLDCICSNRLVVPMRSKFGRCLPLSNRVVRDVGNSGEFFAGFDGIVATVRSRLLIHPLDGLPAGLTTHGGVDVHDDVWSVSGR